MKLIMFGPPAGHNVDPFVSLLRKINQWPSTYICRGEPSWTDHKNLSILSYEKRFSAKIKQLLKNEEAFIWVHGGYDLRQLIAILKHKHPKSIVSLNIWGEQVPRLLQKKNAKSFVYHHVFKKIDQIHCNWYGTYSLLGKYQDKAIVRPWGLVHDFFENEEKPVSGFTEKFIAQMPKEKFIFFYPKSILPVSGQVELIHAVHALKQKGIKNFKVYLWVGNYNDEAMMAECDKFIEKFQLQEFIDIVRHPFLPFADIQKIWQAVNCGLQLAKSDQLSSTFLEPQIMEKPFLATKIKPYLEYENKYKIDLNLIELQVDEIAKAMQALIEKPTIQNEDLKKRAQIVKDNFHFQLNILSFLKEMGFVSNP